MIDEMIEEMKVMISKEIDDSTILGASMIDSIYDHIDEIAEKYKAYKCKWTLIDEESNVYDTDCRNPHILMNGTPTDNEYKYCPYCGKEIEIND